MGSWGDDSWQWNLGIQDSLLVGDLRTQYFEISLLLSNVKPRARIISEFLWPSVLNNSFSIKSRYKFIQRTGEFELLEITPKNALEIMWQSSIAMKVKIFGGDLFLDRCV